MAQLYTHLFAKSYDFMARGLEKTLNRRRTELLSPVRGRVLDVGSGTGVNFQFFDSSCEITALDPSPTMINIAKSKAGNQSNIQFVNHGIDDTNLDNLFQENSFDYIVSTLVLCSVPDPINALNRFHKWLKPDGNLVVMEHIHASKKINRSWQRMINPVWKACGDGCNLTRDTDQLIRQNGFQPIKEDYFRRTLRFYSGEFQPVV